MCAVTEVVAILQEDEGINGIAKLAGTLYDSIENPTLFSSLSR